MPRRKTRRRSSRSKEHEFSGWVRTLAILGALLGILISILMLLDMWPLSYTILPPGLGILVILIVSAIIDLVLCILILISFGVIGSTKKISVNWLILFIVGILLLLFGNIAGILVVISGVIDLVGILKD